MFKVRKSHIIFKLNSRKGAVVSSESVTKYL